VNVSQSFKIGVADFTDCGRLLKPNGEDAVIKGLRIDTDDGQGHEIEGFDYVNHLLGDVVVCGCGEQIDPHQVALFTKKRDFILVPAHCCNKFRWFRGDVDD
jgi:hypothetical protein